MKRIIKDIKEQGVLEKAEIGLSFLSKMFIILKTDGGLRPVFDRRGLNAFIKISHFRLISHALVPDFLQKRDWMIKIDLSQAYFLPLSGRNIVAS